MDKVKHAVVGLMIYGFFLLVFGSVIAVLIVILVALAKEINDEFAIIPSLLTNKKKSGFSFLDFLATILIPLIINMFMI